MNVQIGHKRRIKHKAGAGNRSNTTNSLFDGILTFIAWDATRKQVKTAKPKGQKKSAGTVIVEKYRPRMNKLSAAERQRLLDRALEIAYGETSKPAGSRRG